MTQPDAHASIARDLLKAAKAPPPISAALRHHLDGIYRDIDRHIDAMVTAITAEVPTYGEGAPVELPPEIRAMLHEMVHVSVGSWFRLLFENRAATEQDLLPAADYARQRFQQGVALTDLLQSFRTGASAVWLTLLRTVQHEPALQSELLNSLSSHVLLHTDLLGQVLSQSFQAEERQSREWRDRRYQNFCALIFESPANEARFEALASELGIDPQGRRTALAIRPLDALLTEAGLPRLQELVGSLIARLGTTLRTPLHTLRRETLVIWMVSESGYHPLHQEQGLAEECAALIAAHPGLIEAIGIGIPATGAAGWKRSAKQALSAIGWGRPLQKQGQVYCFSEFVLENSAQHQKHEAEVLEVLLNALQEDPLLLPTLRTWLTTPGLTRKAAAAVLNIHPNTLDYRLKKIEQLTGADLGDMSWLSRFFVALRLREHQ